MDIVAIRRENLKVWFDQRTIPEKEKSYISQLINGKASFGEKAARRLERDYGMGSGYLDDGDAIDSKLATDTKKSAGGGKVWQLDERRTDYQDVYIRKVITMMQEADPEARAACWKAVSDTLREFGDLHGKTSKKGRKSS